MLQPISAPTLNGCVVIYLLTKVYITVLQQRPHKAVFVMVKARTGFYTSRSMIPNLMWVKITWMWGIFPGECQQVDWGCNPTLAEHRQELIVDTGELISTPVSELGC